MSASLRRHLDSLAQTGELVRIRREVDPKFELNAVVRLVQKERNLPILFEKVRGSRHRVASNVMGNYGHLARLIGVDKRTAAKRWAEITKDGRTPGDSFARESDAYGEIALSDLPQIRYFEKDAGPYLTAGVIVARDPDTGVQNLSYHRMQIISPTELRCRLSTSGDLFRNQQKAEQLGQPLKAAVLLGLPPAAMMAGAATISPDQSEYDLAGMIAGKRFPLIPIGDSGLEAPAGTEIMIEGEILANERRPEGPFGDWMDFYIPVMNNHVFVVKRVHARKDAIFYSINPGSTEEIAMTALPMAGSIYTAVRMWAPTVSDVSCFPNVQFCVLRMDKKFEGQPQRAIVAAFGAEMNRMLYCIAVDEDVDIHDPQDVMWAMSTRCRPDRDIFQIPGVPSFARDPHKMHWGRLGVDATRPLDSAADFERKRIPGIEGIRLEDYL
jgi:UbiD family decarboxylase